MTKKELCLENAGSLNLKNKKVTVIGAAKSGAAVAKLVVRQGGIAKISEQQPRSCANEAMQMLLSTESILTEWGGHTRNFIEDSDCVVLSPGVRSNAQSVEWARNKNIPVLGEVEFAWNFCPAPVIAVTGSNGKTTTVTLIAEILKKAGRRVCLCGNIGTPLSSFVLDLTAEDWVVLEISSFQLEATSRFRPDVAVLLNISQNHLDRHKDLDEYCAAKAKIFANQRADDFAILNREIPNLRELAGMLRAQVSFFNEPDKMRSSSNPNHLAALEVARVLGIQEKIAQDVFSSFQGVEHRLERVRTLEGVEYINDSKATTAEAGRWALERVDKPVIMICGGRDKNIDFNVLRPLMKNKVKELITIGEARDKLFQTFHDVVRVTACSSMEEAVHAARQCAHSGDCVVLSPMCASFDMFTDFEERGRVFKNICIQHIYPHSHQI